jgi:hypothetical protein
VADILSGELPSQVTELLARPDSWTRR